MGHAAGHDVDPTFYRSPADAISAHEGLHRRYLLLPGARFAKLGTDPAAGGGLVPDERFFPRGSDFRRRRVHQVRLQGGDASSDSCCYRPQIHGR